MCLALVTLRPRLEGPVRKGPPNPMSAGLLALGTPILRLRFLLIASPRVSSSFDWSGWGSRPLQGILVGAGPPALDPKEPQQTPRKRHSGLGDWRRARRSG